MQALRCKAGRLLRNLLDRCERIRFSIFMFFFMCVLTKSGLKKRKKMHKEWKEEKRGEENKNRKPNTWKDNEWPICHFCHGKASACTSGFCFRLCVCVCACDRKNKKQRQTREANFQWKGGGEKKRTNNTTQTLKRQRKEKDQKKKNKDSRRTVLQS